MLKLFKSQHRAQLGIDISSSSVKILQLSQSGEHYCIDGYGHIALPNGSMDGNAIKDPDEVVKCLKNLLVEQQLLAKKAICAVPDALAISKTIQVNDGLSIDDIEELVMSEADKYIPFPIDEINLDFNVIGPSAKNSAMLDVLLVASRTENVMSRVDVLTRAGLEVVVVDVESYAVERSVQLLAHELPAQGERKIIAIIDIGANYTHLYVLHGMKIIFAREEEFGGHQLIDAMVERYKMKPEEALQAVIENNLPEDYSAEILTPFNESILLQVKRALQFFFSTSQYSFVDHIVLAGGVAKQAGIDKLLQESLSIPTAVANPLCDIKIAKHIDEEQVRRDAPTLLVAFGLALRSLE